MRADLAANCEPTPLRFTTFEDVSGQRPDLVVRTWDELEAELREPKTFPSKQACPLLKLAVFGDKATAKGSLRHDANVLKITGVEGDYDQGLVTATEAACLLDMAGIKAIIYTTPSHADEHPRWRVLCPLSREYAPSERARFVARLNGALRGILAQESFSLSQSYFYGKVRNAPYLMETVEGRFLDLLDDLDENAVGHVTSGPAHRGEIDDFGRQLDIKRANSETIGDLRSALEALPQDWADSYPLWVRIGLALKNLAKSAVADEALELWHEFSKRSDKYQANYCQLTWDSFAPRSVSYAGIFAIAGRTGWTNPRSAVAKLESAEERAARITREKEHAARIGRGDTSFPAQRIMTGSEMLEELVFIADGSRVSFVNNPRWTLSFPDFRRLTAGSSEVVEDGGRRIKKHLAQTWETHPERKTVWCQTFAPGRPRVCSSPRNEKAQNLWRPIERRTPENWEELAKPFFDHLEYLVPVAAERSRFIDWLAHLEQIPGVLPSSHYLMITEQTGIGRNWMACALARVFRGYTALGVDLEAMLRSGGFNDELGETLLAVVDELHSGGPGGTRTERAERLKSFLTEETRTINPKFGRKRVEFNCCRFLMFSNHEAALPLDNRERRVNVIQNPTERKPPEYYAALYRLIEQVGFGDAIAEVLRRRDLTNFNPGEIAPMNDAKLRVIRAGRTELEQAVRDIAAEWPSDCITATRLTREVSDSIGSQSGTQSAGRSAGLTKFRSRVKVAGTAHHVWILRNVAAWANAKSAAVAAEVIRGSKIADGNTAERYAKPDVKTGAACFVGEQVDE